MKAIFCVKKAGAGRATEPYRGGHTLGAGGAAGPQPDRTECGVPSAAGGRAPWRGPMAPVP